MKRRARLRVLLAVSLAAEVGLILGLVGSVEARDPIVGDPFPVNTGAMNDLDPAIAYNSQRGEFLVTWEWNGDILGRIVTQRGELSDFAFVFVNGTFYNPDVAYNSCVDEYLIAWDDGANTWGTRMSGQGIMSGGYFLIAAGTSPAAAFNDFAFNCDYLVVWEEYYWVFGGPGSAPGPHKGVWGQRVAGTSGSGDSGGELIGAAFTVQNDVQTHHFYYEPDVAYNLSANEYLVVYTYDPSRGGDAAVRDIKGQRIRGDGLLEGQPTTIDSSSYAQEKPAVAANPLNATTPWLVSYDDYWQDAFGDVSAMRISADGSTAAWLPVAAAGGHQELESDVAAEGSGGYVVVWSVFPWNIHGRRVDSGGTMGPTFCVSVRCGNILALALGEHRDPAVAGGSPLGLAVWEDNGWPAGNSSWDIAGQLLGYRAHLPLVLRKL